LIRDNQTFGQVLSDGRTLDEAITPADFVTRDNRGLFELLFDRLSSGQSVTLAGFLGDLAEEQEHALSALLTQADTEVDSATGGKQELVGQVLALAAQALLDHQREAQYRQTKQALAASDDAQSTEPDQARLLQRMIEHRRDNPSPVRIARVRR
jgi:DNA primase